MAKATKLPTAKKAPRAGKKTTAASAPKFTGLEFPVIRLQSYLSQCASMFFLDRGFWASNRFGLSTMDAELVIFRKPIQDVSVTREILATIPDDWGAIVVSQTDCTRLDGVAVSFPFASWDHRWDGIYLGTRDALATMRRAINKISVMHKAKSKCDAVLSAEAKGIFRLLGGGEIRLRLGEYIDLDYPSRPLRLSARTQEVIRREDFAG